MYELFYFPNNASLAPHFVLEEIGTPFVLRLVDRTANRQKDPDYMKRNPMGRIPTLVDGDFVLFESAAICLHLADRHPEARLAPPLGTDARAHLYQWLMFLTNTIQPDFMTYYYADKHTSDPQGAAGVKTAAEERLNAAYRVVDEALRRGGPYLLGAAPSVADLFLLMLVRWSAGLTHPPSRLSAIGTCIDLLSARPSVQRALATEKGARGASDPSVESR